MSAPQSDSTVNDEIERLRAQRDALQAELASLQRRRRPRRVARRAAVVVLVVLACLSLAAATVAVWANRTLLTTDGWVETVGPLGSDPAVTAALQPRITEAVFSAIPAEDLVADALPEDRAFLAAPLSSAIQSFVDDQVGAFLASDTYAQLWVETNEVAHERALAVLRGEGVVQVSGGDTVTLNLLPVINRVLGELSVTASGLLGQDVTLPTISSGEVPAEARERLNAALGIELPEDVGQIPVYDADELIAAQQALRVFDQALVLLVIATPLLLVAAVWLSRNRRRTIIELTVGTVLLLVLVRRVVLRFQETVVALPPQPQGQAAARTVTEQLRGGLFDATGMVIAVAVVVLAIALVTGPHPWAVALRRGVAHLGHSVWTTGGRLGSGADADGAVDWMTQHRQALQVGGVALVAGLLLVTDIPWGWFLAVIVLLACWELILWRLGGDAGGVEADPTVRPAPR